MNQAKQRMGLIDSHAYTMSSHWVPLPDAGAPAIMIRMGSSDSSSCWQERTAVSQNVLRLRERKRYGDRALGAEAERWTFETHLVCNGCLVREKLLALVTSTDELANHNEIWRQ